jgi:hypothetical protein
MNRISIILLLTIFALGKMAAKSNPPTTDSTSCEWLRWYYEAPAFYCACTNNSHTFAFPLDTVISGSLWFTATVNDLKKGLSAYWFSSDSVTMEVYPLCVSQAPAIAVTIAPNRMYELDMTEINKKLDEMSDVAYLQSLTPHIHVYTRHGGEGHVYCYPYDQGPHSTCDAALEMRPGMTYVCNHEENVYWLDWRNISSRGSALLRWLHRPKSAKQTCQPAEVWITRDSCNGLELARATIIDSMHVYRLDSAMLVGARQAQTNLFVHVQHAPGLTGRLIYFNNPLFVDPLDPIQQSTCLGKTLTVSARIYSADTAFVDTVWVGRDSLATQSVQLTFRQPEEITDTLYLTERQIRGGYRHQPTGVVLYEFGDSIIDIVKASTCTVRYHVWIVNTTGVEDADAHKSARKLLQDGQLFILIDERKYTLWGQQIN